MCTVLNYTYTEHFLRTAVRLTVCTVPSSSTLTRAQLFNDCSKTFSVTYP